MPACMKAKGGGEQRYTPSILLAWKNNTTLQLGVILREREKKVPVCFLITPVKGILGD